MKGIFMKVPAISPQNRAIYSLNNKKASDSIQKNDFKTNNYMNNPTLESTGRMQVQFLGEYKEGNAGGLIYRDKNSRIVYGADGSLNFVTLELGKKTKINETLDKKTKEITYSNGDTLYFELDKNTGNSKEVVFENEMNREIYTTVTNGEKVIQILDLDTNTYVTEGEKAWRVEDSKDIMMRSTRNIITGVLVKRESYNPNCPFTDEFDEKTSIIKRSTSYDKDKDIFKELIYDSNGNVTFEKTESSDRKYKVYIERDANSGKEISHIEMYYGNNEILQKAIKLYPNTNAVMEDIIYTDKEIRRDIYNQNPNVRTKTLIFDKNSNYLKEEDLYFKNGENKSISTLYFDNGTKIINRFDEETNLPVFVEEYEPDGFMNKIRRNWPGSNKTESIIEYNRNKGIIIETQFDESGKYFEKRTVQDMYNKTKKEYVEFYPRSNKMKVQYIYYENFYVVNNFDITGGYTSSERKPYNTRTFRLYTYEDIFGETEKQEVPLTGKIIEKIIKVTGSAESEYSDVSDEEWSAFIKFIGLDNFNELINMDKKTYKKLTKRFHPDKSVGNSTSRQRLNEDITKIINNIHDSNKKHS